MNGRTRRSPAGRVARGLRFLTAMAFVGGATACAGLLGLEDRTLRGDAGGDDGSMPSPDGSVPAEDSVSPGADGTPAPPVDGTSPSPDAGGADATDSAPPADGRAGCAGDACGPVALIAPNGPYLPTAIAQDDGNLYFSDFSQIAVYAIAKDGGTARTLYSYSASKLPASIAVDDASVYWGDDDGIWRCPKTGCPGAKTRTLVVPVDPNNNDILSIAIDTHNVYWTDDLVFTVESAPLSGADAGKLLWSGAISPERVTTDGQRVFFTADDGLLHIVAVDGGAVSPSTLGTYNDAGSLGITYENQTVMWTVAVSGTGTIQQTSTASLAAQPIVTGQNLPTSVASDGLNVYWLNFGLNANGVLRGCTILNCQPATLYSPIETPRALLVDGTWIFWLDEGTGSIWRIPK